MLKNLASMVASPLTKYMGIAILILIGALSGAVYLSYKFYGDKAAAEVVTEQLEVVVEQEKEQTGKALDSLEIINEAVSNVREGEKKLQKVSETLQEAVSNPTPTNPTGDTKNEPEAITEPCDSYLSDDDIRLLQQAHCLTDGDTGDCY